MPNPFISFRCPKELAEKIRARAKQLGFDDPGDYLRQLARREIFEADGKAFSIVAEQAAVCGGTIINRSREKRKT